MKMANYVLLLLLCPLFSYSQAVTTLTNVTANGGVSLDQDGNLFVAHFGPLPITPGQEGKNIYKITPTGEVTLFFDQLNVGSGNHVDGNGFLYQSSFRDNRVFKITDQGILENDTFAEIPGPVGITVIENDTLLVCSCNTNSVIKVSQHGDQSTFASGATFNCANGITQDDSGNIYTTNFSDGRITKITSNGETTTLGSVPAGNGHITYRATDQMLYIASYSANRIYQMDLSGNATLFAGTGSAGALDADDPLMATFNKPNGIEISHDGCNLYVTQDNNVLRAIKFKDGNCLSAVENPAADSQITLFPNPTKGAMIIENDSEIALRAFSMFDASGKTIVYQAPIQSNNIDISMISSGIYFIELVGEEGIRVRKKIVLE